MDKTKFAIELDETSLTLMELYVALAGATIDEMNAEAELETKKASSIVSGEIVGRNEEERKAHARILLSADIRDARDASIERIKKHYHVKALESRRDSLVAILNSLK